MPDSKLSPDSPGAWLNRARSDLTIARTSIPGVYLEDLCYHAQQTAEKALKSLLLHVVGDFPYVHDLAVLVSRLQAASQAIPPQVQDAVRLTRYAVAGRYPGFDEPVTAEEWREACQSAEDVLRWVEGELARESGPDTVGAEQE